MSYTLLEIEQRLSQAIGDDLEFDSTTNIAANNSVVSTTLLSYDSSQNDAFNQWWLYITEGNNITVNRQISDYATTTGTLTVRGAALSAEAGAVTMRLHKYNRDYKKWAINRALEELYPALYARLDDLTLITDNILPDGHFEDWTSSSALRMFTASNITLTKTSTAGTTRGGVYSAKCAATAGNGYIYISSDSYPRLLDLAGHQITFKAWAYPEVANDATIEIYTVKPDGTAQTLTSTTTCPAGKYSQLVLENQSINEGIEEIQFRFKVTTNAKYVYFDDARVESPFTQHEYLLPIDFRLGHVSQVMVQREGTTQDEMCDDIRPQSWYWTEHHTYNDGTYEYLYLPEVFGNNRRIRLVGSKPLTAFSADSDTITLDAQRVELLVACAAYKLFQRLQTPVSSTDKSRFANELSMWDYKYRSLLQTHSMPSFPEKVRTV